MKPGSLAVLLAVSLAAAAPTHARPASGTYRGSTSQGLPMKLAVSAGEVGTFRLSVYDSCGDRRVVSGLLEARVRRTGRFSKTIAWSGNELWLRGRFRGSTATGSLRSRDGKDDGRVCDSGVVSFTIRR